MNIKWKNRETVIGKSGDLLLARRSERRYAEQENYIKNGNFEYILDAKKLINDGVTDPSKFVREQFQDVFKKNAKELFEQNQEFFKKLNITNETFLKNLADNNRLIDHPLFDLIIKVE